jgi:DNA repair exonuclease SbcCD ATPase subunit
MALTAKFLKGLGLTDEQTDAILEGHGETIKGLKDERDDLKNKLKDFDDVQRELDELKAKDSDGNGYEKKYTDLKAQFDAYKKEQETKATHGAKAAAYKNALKEAGVSEKFFDKVLKVTDVDSLELDVDGKFKDAEKIAKSIKDDWGDFIKTDDTHGADTQTPPPGGNVTYTHDEISKMTPEQINANWDAISKSLKG